MDSAEQKTKALEFFKDWTNYMLVTTVAALGWVSSQSHVVLGNSLKARCIWSFALSIVFAILTLALIPAIAEGIRRNRKSIYEIEVQHKFRLRFKYSKLSALPRTRRYRQFEFTIRQYDRLFQLLPKLRLRTFCFWQHLFFLIGVLLYAWGTAN